MLTAPEPHGWFRGSFKLKRFSNEAAVSGGQLGDLPLARAGNNDGANLAGPHLRGGRWIFRSIYDHLWMLYR